MAVPWAFAIPAVQRKRHVRLLSSTGGGGYDQSESIVHLTKRVTKDGRTFDASVTISPVCDAEGSVPRRSSATRARFEHLKRIECLKHRTPSQPTPTPIPPCSRSRPCARK